MEKIRILLLTHFIITTFWKYTDWAAAGYELEAVSLSNSFDEYYRPSLSMCEEIRELTSQHQVDLVIIGNNLGGGLKMAAFVHEDLLPKTVVVWNSYRDEETVPYAKMGIRHFGTRDQITQIIQNILGASI